LTIQLDRAGPDEVPAIRKALADNDWGLTTYERGEWFVARDAGEIVGVIHATDVDPETRYFDDVLVVKDRRGSGIGAELMRFVMADRDAAFYLVCHEPRIAFYRRLGFELVDESDAPDPIREHAHRTDDLPTSPDHVHHLMRRPRSALADAD
jgi:N-acetylglutamate synthase-like GNAT family acetyltransferase